MSERQRQAARLTGLANRKHGGSGTVEYQSWFSMTIRCSDPTDRSYANYGARGISVCERWRVFADFLVDMGPKPTPKHTLERKDNERGYEPSNCCWITRKEQNNNQRRTHRLTIGAETKSVTEWAEKRGVNPNTVYSRLKAGLSPERALQKGKIRWKDS